VACTGVHGANRLASNSLLEGLVFGARSAAAMRAAAREVVLAATTVTAAVLSGNAREAVPSVDEVRDLMWRQVGVVRSRPGLEIAVAQLKRWAGAVSAWPEAVGEDPERRRVTSIVTSGFLIARAALRREESRGAHFRTDFPTHDDLHWKMRTADRLHVD
jgi:L-aspartate oxidase